MLALIIYQRCHYVVNDGIKYDFIEWIHVPDTVTVHANDIDTIQEPIHSMFTPCNHRCNFNIMTLFGAGSNKKIA